MPGAAVVRAPTPSTPIHGFSLLASGAGSVMRDSSASLVDRGVHDICYYLDVRRLSDI